MSQKNRLEDLEKAITRFYDGYSAKRVALATFVVGVVVLFTSLGVYSWTESALIAAIAAFALGLIAINVAFLTIVPPALALQQSKELIVGAIRDPSRIKTLNMQKVQLIDIKGKAKTLGGREMGVWTRLVVPYLIQCQADGQLPSSRKKSSRTLTASERKYIEQRRKEVLEIEKKIEEDRKKLESDRKEIEIRTSDLKQAEEVVIARLTGVERAEAEIEQLKIAAAERAGQSDEEYDKAELRAKEIELVKLKDRLAKDRESLDQQKAEMQRLKESMTKVPFPKSKDGSPAEISLAEREAALEKRQRELEKEATALEKRANFVTDSENSLIERLDALSEREAHVEQSEINAGLKEDK